MLQTSANTAGALTKDPASPTYREQTSVQGRALQRAREIAGKANRLLVLTAGVGTLLAAVCVAATVYGHINPSPEAVSALGLERCAGVPCVKGVTPGVTRWPDAVEAFAPLPKSQPSDMEIVVPLGTAGKAFLYPSLDGSTVRVIYIQVSPETLLPLGELVQHYGPPSQIGIKMTSLISDTLRLYYPTSCFTAQIVNGRLTTETPVRTIMLCDPTFSFSQSQNPCTDYPQETYASYAHRPWRGFASISFYQAKQ
jgi:hypothetical protein